MWQEGCRRTPRLFPRCAFAPAASGASARRLPTLAWTEEQEAFAHPRAPWPPALASGGFVRELAARDARPLRGRTGAALQALPQCDWPGDVREARNVIEPALALCPGAEIDSVAARPARAQLPP